MEAPVARFTQNALRLPSWLIRKWTFQSWKTLRQISHNLSHEILVTWTGDLFTNHSSRKKRVFCTLKVIFRAIFKNFSFFPCILWLFIVLSVSASSKLIVFTHKTSIFVIISSPIFKKRYGFSLFLKVFHVSSPGFLGFCVFVWILKYDVEYGLWIFCWVWCLGSIGFGSILPIIHVFHVYFSFWVLYLVCVVFCISYPW